VVCDTSPLSNLAIIGRLELLREQFEVVRMPAKVAHELEALRDPAAQAMLASALDAGWLIEIPLPDSAPYPDALRGLDAGETEALRLAIAISADAVLIDEKEGRQRAASLGLQTIGALGVLIAAKRKGRIPSLAIEIATLRKEAGFFVDASLEAQVLASVGE
jgi:uncharacterized protein